MSQQHDPDDLFFTNMTPAEEEERVQQLRMREHLRQAAARRPGARAKRAARAASIPTILIGVLLGAPMTYAAASPPTWVLEEGPSGVLELHRSRFSERLWAIMPWARRIEQCPDGCPSPTGRIAQIYYEGSLVAVARPSGEGKSMRTMVPITILQPALLSKRAELTIRMVPAAASNNTSCALMTTPDADSDGDGAPDRIDCSCADPEVRPGAVEACDGKDNNCNYIVDEGCPGIDPTKTSTVTFQPPASLRPSYIEVVVKKDGGPMVAACRTEGPRAIACTLPQRDLVSDPVARTGVPSGSHGITIVETPIAAPREQSPGDSPVPGMSLSPKGDKKTTDIKTSESLLPSVLADGFGDPYTVAVDTSAVYVGELNHEPTGPRLWRIDKATHQKIILSDRGHSISHLVLDDEYVYWNELSGPVAICRVPKLGGNTEILVPDLHYSYDLALAGSYLYWMIRSDGKSDGLIQRTDRAGGRVEIVADGLQGEEFETDGSRLFWLEQGWILSSPMSSNDTQVLLSADGRSNIQRLALWGDLLYFVRRDAGTVESVSVRDGKRTVIATQQPNPSQLAFDTTSVYWATFDRPGTIRSAPLHGGEVRVIATNQGNPRALAVDDTAVYWGSQDEQNRGVLMMVAKKR